MKRVDGGFQLQIDDFSEKRESFNTCRKPFTIITEWGKVETITPLN